MNKISIYEFPEKVKKMYIKHYPEDIDITYGNLLRKIDNSLDSTVEVVVKMVQRLDEEIADFTDDSGWINFRLENDVQAYDGHSKPAMRRIGNRVFIRGAIKNLTTVGTVLYTLPTDYRPAMTHIFTTSADGENTVNNNITISISSTDGTISISAKTGTISATDRISIATTFLAATGTPISMIYDYKGSVVNYSDLPDIDLNAGDVYMVLRADETSSIAAGDNVMWNGEEWEVLETVVLSSEIDSIINSIE